MLAVPMWLDSPDSTGNGAMVQNDPVQSVKPMSITLCVICPIVTVTLIDQLHPFFDEQVGFPLSVAIPVPHEPRGMVDGVMVTIRPVDGDTEVDVIAVPARPFSLPSKTVAVG